MANPTQTPPERRPSVFEPQDLPPFYRTPEFKRFAILAGLLLLFALPLAYVALQSAPSKGGGARGASEPGVPVAPAIPPPPATATLTDAERAQREAALSTMFEGALTDQDNGQDFAETTGYRKLLEQLARFTPEDVHARTERALDYRAVLADPDAWRGEFVRAHGVVGEIWRQRLDRPVLGHADVWRGQLEMGRWDENEREGESTIENAYFECLERPVPELSAEDLKWRAVEIEGVLYRTVTFESRPFQRQGRTVTATWTVPWVLVRNIRLVDEGGGTPKGLVEDFLRQNAILILAVMAFVVFGGQLVLYWIGRRKRGIRKASQPAGIREMFEQKLREKGVPPPSPTPQDPRIEDG